MLFAGAWAARLPDLGPWTLGVLSERLDVAVVAGAVATLLGVLIWRRYGGLLGSAAVLALTYGFDADVTRRRSALLALLCLGIPWALHAALDRGKERKLPWILCAALAWVGVGVLIAADQRPYRTGLPPIAKDPPPPNAPHIVLITMDTTRYDALVGSDRRDWTPSLTRFARTALNFRETLAEASHTHPSMASLLTSRMPIEHDSIATSPVINPSLTTLATHLRRSGYRTAGFLENPWLGPDFGLADGYEYLHSKAERSRIDAWLRKDSEAPAFLHVHLFEPHGPYELRDAYLGPEGLDFGGGGPVQLGTTISAEFIRSGEEPGTHQLSPADFRWIQGIYLTEVAAMDRWIGQFIEHAERVLGAGTIFVITADHGEEFGDHGGLHHGHTLYRELVHVPLMIRVPGVAPRDQFTPAGLVDVAPTILDAAGLPPLPNAAGRSLLPVGPAESPAESPAAAPLVSTRFFKGDEHLFSIQSGPWRLHLRLDQADFIRVGLNPVPIDFEREALPGTVELYRWTEDPGEQRSVALEHPDVVRRLQAELSEWQAAADERGRKDRSKGARREPSQSTYDRLRGLGYSGVLRGIK